ncbi:4Fe-4S dicluster domain-containing protein [Gemmatimonadota bacterium]
MSEDQVNGAAPAQSAEEAGAGAGAGFLLDLSACVGCGACVLACRIENDLPRGLSWRRIVSFNLPRWPGGATYHFSVACHHCEDPPCVAGCPSGALRKRPDGVVALKSSLCIGCQYCAMICPFGAPAYYREAGVMTKCTLCSHRLDQLREPACVEACPTRALRFTREVDAADDFMDATEIPGFSDPGNARPSLRFSLPGGGIRGARHEALKGRLAAGGGMDNGPREEKE